MQMELHDNGRLLITRISVVSSAALLLLSRVGLSNLAKLGLSELFFSDSPIFNLVEESEYLSCSFTGFFVEAVHKGILAK